MLSSVDLAVSIICYEWWLFLAVLVSWVDPNSQNVINGVYVIITVAQ